MLSVGHAAKRSAPASTHEVKGGQWFAGGGQLQVRLYGCILKDDERKYVTVGFSGDGSVYTSFIDRLNESVDGAEWFESLETLRWKAFTNDLMSALE